MTLRICLALVSAACVTSAQPKACKVVEGDRLVAADFAAVLPAFASLAPDTPLAAAPVPGARRVFRSPELTSLAKRYSLDLAEPADICFQWELHPLNPERILEAMRAALPLPDLQIEIAEVSLYPVPSGRIEFRQDGLGHPASPESRIPVIWRGHVVYAGNHRLAIWAKVLVLAAMPRVVATQTLKRGQPIRAEQVRLVSTKSFPFLGDLPQTLEGVVGKAPACVIASGALVHTVQLTTPPDVKRGELVEVEVRSGSARLALTAKAESNGRVGETVAIRNPSSNRVFQARVSGQGKAVLDATSGSRN